MEKLCTMHNITKKVHRLLLQMKRSMAAVHNINEGCCMQSRAERLGCPSSLTSLRMSAGTAMRGCLWSSRQCSSAAPLQCWPSGSLCMPTPHCLLHASAHTQCMQLLNLRPLPWRTQCMHRPCRIQHHQHRTCSPQPAC